MNIIRKINNMTTTNKTRSVISFDIIILDVVYVPAESALVAQWIEYVASDHGMGVRFPPVAHRWL